MRRAFHDIKFSLINLFPIAFPYRANRVYMIEKIAFQNLLVLLIRYLIYSIKPFFSRESP